MRTDKLFGLRGESQDEPVDQQGCPFAQREPRVIDQANGHPSIGPRAQRIVEQNVRARRQPARRLTRLRGQGLALRLLHRAHADLGARRRMSGEHPDGEKSRKDAALEARAQPRPYRQDEAGYRQNCSSHCLLLQLSPRSYGHG